VRNPALARDLVISHVYPMAGNKAALGVDYRTVPNQWPGVRQVIEENRILIAGPVELVQGGTGVIARFPIFLRRTPSNDRPLWGIAATVIDFPGLLQLADYASLEQEYRVALVGRDGNVESDEVIWGDTEIRAARPVALDVVFPNGQWRVLAAPRSGWPTLTSFLPYTILAAAIFLALVAVWSVASYRIAAERSATQREVLAALQRAEEASAAKSTFLAVMSHELRTPLNAIIGFSELLENSPRDGRVWERAPEYVADIQQSGRFLLSIIDDILDLSRIESGRRNATVEHVDVVPLMIDTANRLRVEFDAKEIALSVEAEQEQMVAMGDPRAIMQILVNLLTNALKYAGPSATVAVTGRYATGEDGDPQIVLSVADDGPGIPEEKIDEIMKPFVQLSSSYARAAGGVGLGLTICQSLARMMNGALTVESQVGAGATVRLTLPRSSVA
jgi:two-component system sensor histidine kinase ChiS